MSATGRKLDRAWNLVVLSNVVFNEDVERTSFTKFMISNEYNHLLSSGSKTSEVPWCFIMCCPCSQPLRNNWTVMMTLKCNLDAIF